MPRTRSALFTVWTFSAWLWSWAGQGQEPLRLPAPSAAAARILLLPRQVVAGERATLAVLDVGGRLTPGVVVNFSNGDQVTTDATGRAVFAAPLTAGVVFGSIANRPGQVAMTILRPEEAAGDSLLVTRAPRVASLADRFEISGRGFCGEADANRVSVGGQKALVLAASPASLDVLPPETLEAGPAEVNISCAKKSLARFSVLFVGLSLEADSSPIRPGQHRILTVHVTGTTGKVTLEAHNLAPEIAELQGGEKVRLTSSGSAENTARFEVVGKGKGSFLISIRLVTTGAAPK